MRFFVHFEHLVPQGAMDRFNVVAINLLLRLEARRLEKSAVAIGSSELKVVFDWKG
jgi:hypothetical protein